MAIYARRMPMRMVLVGLVSVVVWLAACDPSLHSRSLRRAQMATPNATQTGYFATRSDSHGEWMLRPPGFPIVLLRDEATLAMSVAGRTCVDLVFRSKYDEPFAEWPTTFVVDGVSAEPRIIDEHAIERSHAADGYVIAADGGEVVVATITERRARLCVAAGPARAEVYLGFEDVHGAHYSMLNGRHPYELRFRWKFID